MEYTIGFKPCQLESRYYKKAPILTSECLLIVGEGSITLGKSLKLLRQISTSLTGALPFALSSSSNSLFVSPNPYLSQNNKTPTLIGGCFVIGGEGEIRTHGGVAPSTVFKTAALNRSATSPFGD